MTGTQIRSGLDGVIAAETRISRVDGDAGELVIAGYPLEAIADRATFEEMVYLLWHDALPTPGQLKMFAKELTTGRDISTSSIALLAAAAKYRTPAMEALLMAAATLHLQTPPVAENAMAHALSIVGHLPTLTAAYSRLLDGRDPIAARSDLGHAANYLYMLTGWDPTAEKIRALETYLCTVADHGLNASTFTARVIVSTRSDMLSAVVGAIGALKGPLHGGAPGPALEMILEIGSADRAESYLRRALERGERLMGFGHRIYKVRDPRADVLAEAASRLYQTEGDRQFYALALEIERIALRLLDEYKPGRRLHTNVEFYTALLLHGVGLPPHLFAPTFTLGRVAGWIAHCMEQQRIDRLIRPQSLYVGARDRRWVPVEERE